MIVQDRTRLIGLLVFIFLIYRDYALKKKSQYEGSGFVVNEIIYYIWLNFIENIRLTKKFEMLNFFGGIDNLYKAKKQDYIKCGFLTDVGISALCCKDLHTAQDEYKRSLELGVRFVTLEGAEYPERLKEISDPPVLLYTKGDVSLLNRELAICIVGSREPTNYGESTAIEISRQLAECGMVIVSGCALGIDSAAHMGAIRARGKTIGVMGCGINQNYPIGNRALRDEMEKTGLLISEFPLDTNALPGNFPQRNRIMSGLALGVAVIEAGYKSGSLITANYALDQNKDVYAVPGNIGSINSGGTNKMIADGNAAMLLGAEMILDEYLLRYPHLFERQAIHIAENEVPEAVAEPFELFENPQAEGEEKKILQMLKGGEKSVDDIIACLEKPASFVNSALSVMQIKGYIYEKPGRIYGKK